MTPDCRRYSSAVGREGVPATGTDPVIRSSFEDPEGTRSSPGVIDRKPGADSGRGARLTSENTPGVFSSLQAACLGFTFLSALFGFPLENSRGRPEKAFAESDRPCTELRNRNQTIAMRVGMSWAAAHDCRKSPAYEGGVSMVEADRPVPLVAGDSRHRSNERSRYDQLWICRDPAVVFVRPDNKATTLIFRSMHLVGSSISGKCSH